MPRACMISILLIFISAKTFAQCDTVDLALGQPAIASSLENASLPASNAFDGDTTGTRWSSAFSDPQYIYVDLGATYNLCQVTLFWEAALGKDFTIDISNDASSWTTVASITGNISFENIISISGSGRYVRMNGTARGTGYGYSLYEFQVFGFPATCNTVNLALGQAVVSSSVQTGFPAGNAVDGDPTTRWSSNASDPQFIYVDLGGVHNICQVSIYWEAAYASSYNIDVSTDAASWTTIDSVKSNTSLTNIHNVAGSGRYVRMYGLTRATPFGYSLYEMQVRDITILPVELTGFAGIVMNNGRADLQWTTALEANLASFQIERSTDGKTFSGIGLVPASGNSTAPRNYQFTDSLPVEGADYYRLKQLDLDGKFTYSKQVVLYFKGQNGGGAIVYPNPTTTATHISTTDGSIILQITVYNAAGKQIAQQSGSPASTTILFQTGMLPKGLYIVKLNTDKGISNIKLLK